MKAGMEVARVAVLAGLAVLGVSVAMGQPKESVPQSGVTIEGTVVRSDGSVGVNVPVQVFRAIEASNPGDSLPPRGRSAGMEGGVLPGDSSRGAVGLQRAPFRTVRTDDKGAFKVQLPVGKYNWRAGTPAMGLASGELEVKATDNKKVEIKLVGG